MFHRVSQSEKPEEKPQASETETSQKKQDSAKQTPLNETNTQQPTATQTQRKDTQTMNANTPDSKPAQQGNYRPSPAQPQSRMDIPGAQASTATRTPASAYPGSSSGPSNYSPQPSANDGNKKLQIGPGITLSGEIEDCEYLYVEGTVEAALKGASVLEIAESGAFYGTVEIDEATIAGRFEGDLSVRGRLTIEATGSITGSVAYKELAVEAGATLDGKVTPLGAKGEARVTEGNFQRGKAKKPASTPAKAQNDDELPFSDTAAVTAAE